MRDYPNILVAFLDNFEEGYVFERWPQHITILPWFKANKEALADLESISKNHLPVPLVVGRTAMFGHRDDIPVRLVESESLKRLHRDLLSKRLGILGLINSNYVLDGFRPHITLQGENDPQSGYLSINQISLVKKLETGKIKQIVKNYSDGR